MVVCASFLRVSNLFFIIMLNSTFFLNPFTLFLILPSVLLPRCSIFYTLEHQYSVTEMHCVHSSDYYYYPLINLLWSMHFSDYTTFSFCFLLPLLSLHYIIYKHFFPWIFKDENISFISNNFGAYSVVFLHFYLSLISKQFFIWTFSLKSF